MSRKCRRRTEYDQELQAKRTVVKQETEKKVADFSNDVLPNIISNLQQAQEIISKDPKFERGLKMKKFLKIVLKAYGAGGKRSEMKQTETSNIAEEQTGASNTVNQNPDNVVMKGMHFMTKESYGLVKMK